MSAYDYLYKIIILGDAATGKSSYLKRLVTGEGIDSTIRSTVGVDFRSKIYDINGTKFKIHMWDTAGQEIYHSIVSSYYRQAVGILLFVDMSQPQSFKNAERWIADIKKHLGRDQIEESAKVMVVANKHDLATGTADFINWIDRVKFDYRIISTKDDPIAKIERPIICLAEKIDRAWPNGSHPCIRKYAPLQIKTSQRKFCTIL